MNINYGAVDENKLMRFLAHQEDQSVRWGNEFENAGIDLLLNGGTLTGSKLPWCKSHDQIRFREGEI